MRTLNILASIANLILHGYIVWLVILEFRAPYQFPRWRWKWGFMGLATGLMLIWRVYTFFWLHTPLRTWGPPTEILTPYVWLGIAIALALSLRQARLIYSPVAPLAPAPPAVILMDTSSIVMGWNAAATRLFGWTEAEALGQPLPELIIPERLRRAHWDGVARWLDLHTDHRHLKPQYFPVARHKRGHEFQVEVTITALPQQDGAMQFLGSVRKLIAV